MLYDYLQSLNYPSPTTQQYIKYYHAFIYFLPHLFKQKYTLSKLYKFIIDNTFPPKKNFVIYNFTKI